MGLSEALSGKRIYVDANVFIYLVEAVEEFGEVSQVFRRLLMARAFEAVTSNFTLCEVLVQPFRRGADEDVEAYRSLIETSGAFTLIPLDTSILIEAARLRATLRLRTPDAIHVACALRTNCTAFLSNDRRLQLPSSIDRVDFG